MPDNVADRMAAALEPAILDAVRLIGERAHEQGLPAFLVGGCVRDLLLEEPIADIDILIEGDAIAFAHSLSDQTSRIREHQRFGTAKVTLKDGLHVDLASARREFYQHPAALPEVEHSTVREDLYRRDFTINAMAVSLAPGGLGALADFFGGKRDLEEGHIRVLHSLSFVEDPTRVLRAIRLEGRLRFQMEPVTESLVRRGATAEAFDRLSGQRFRQELIAILEDRAPVAALRRMAELDVLRLVHPALLLTEATQSLMERCQRVFRWQSTLPDPPVLDRWVCLLLPLIAELSPEQGRNLVQRLRLPAKRAHSLLIAAEAAPELEDKLSDASLRPSRICALLEPYPPLAGLFVLAKTDDPVVSAAVGLYFQELRLVRADIGGGTLIAAGYQPGPGFAKALRAARAAKMDGEAPTPEVQQAVARKVLDEWARAE